MPLSSNISFVILKTLKQQGVIIRLCRPKVIHIL